MPHRFLAGRLAQGSQSLLAIGFFKKSTNLFVRVNDGADRDIMVHCRNVIGNILRNIYLVEPCAALQFRREVSKVRTEHAVQHTLLHGLVKSGQPVREDGISGVGKNAACALLFQGEGNVQHAFARTR